MSWASEYQKLRDQRNVGEVEIHYGKNYQKVTPKSGGKLSAKGNLTVSKSGKKKKKKETTSGKTLAGEFREKHGTPEKKSWAEEYQELRQQRFAEIEALKEKGRLEHGRKVSAAEYKATGKDTDESKKKDGRKWFQKGLFEDGYDFGDISKTILGTAADIGEDALTGLIGMGEKAVDAVAQLAPYVQNAQFYQNGGGYNLEAEKLHRQMMEDAKKQTSEFVARDLYDEQKVAQKILSSVPGAMRNATITLNGGQLTQEDMDLYFQSRDEADKYIQDRMELESVLGEKSDALVQSAGQLAGQYGLTMVGVPWWLTAGATSFGAEAEQALKEGATHNEATGSALISAGAEIVSEKLFGGDIFTKGGSDLVTSYLSRAVSDKTLRTLAKLGYDMAGEGVEEVFSEFMGNLGSSLYKEESLGEILFNEEAFEAYLESFVGGAALGGVMGGINAAQSNAQGVDYTSGLTKNEEAVVQKVYEDRVAEQGGDKLTASEKKKIYDKVLSDMDKGYISIETIEEVLGGDTYKTYRETADSYSQMEQEYKDLMGMKRGEMTGEQQAREAELKAKLEKMRQSGEVDQKRTAMRDSVYSLISGDRLAESYNEQARRGQRFTADLSQYDEKQRAAVQRAIDSGVLNDTNRSHELVDTIARIEADKGLPFDFTNNERLRQSGFAIEGKQVNGYVTSSGVTLNVESPKAWQSTVGHEVTHVLEGTDMYDAFRETLFRYAESRGELESRRASLAETYKDVKDADIDAELTADLVGEYLFGDSDFVSRLSTENRTVFEKIFDEIKYLFRVVTAGSKEAQELEKVKRAFEQAYKAEGKGLGDTKYSISDSSGQELSPGQQEYFKNSRMRDADGNLMVMYHGSQDAGFHTFDASMSDDGTSFFFVDRNEVAATYSGTTETYEARTIRNAEDMNKFIAEIGSEGYEVVEQDGKFVLLYEGDQVATSETAKGIYDEFCWYEGVGDGDANYKVYLNLTNPLEVDAQGRNWNNVSREFSQEVYDRYTSLTEAERAALTDLAGWGEYGVFRDELLSVAKAMSEGNVPEYLRDLASAYEKIGGVNANLYDAFSIAEDGFSEESLRQYSVKQMTTRDYARMAKEQGYDGVIFRNIHDNGGYSNGSEGASTVAIAFKPEQIKSVRNAEPTGDADIRFSLSEPVEETKDLVAVHNLTAQKLQKSLRMGGLPMPSIAVARAKDGHGEFGEISLIFKKDTIDPAVSTRNKLYSGDAWTPMYPSVDYKVSEKTLARVRGKIESLVPHEVQVFGRLALDSANMEDVLNRYGGDAVEAFKDNDALKYAYLMEAGADVELPMREKNLSYSGSRENGAIIKVAEALSADEISRALNGGSEETRKLEPIVRKAVAEYVRETYGDDQFILDTFAPEAGLSFSDLDGYLTEARKYHRTGIERTVDPRPARQLIQDMTVQYSYEEWLRELFAGIVEKEGIRNNRDYLTPSGNRRSFEALHYEHNLENVIKAMREQGEKGIGNGFGGASIFGASTTEFSSVDEMKQARERLRTMSYDEYQELRKGFTDRFHEIAMRLPKEKNSFTAVDSAAEVLTEAVAKYSTRRGIANYLRRELNGWATYSDEVVDDLIELVSEIRNMPTGYFEAKPQRAVGFDEVAVFVIPYNADPALKQKLLSEGYSIAEYDPNVEGDRQRVVNGFEELKFSLSPIGATDRHGTPMSDLRYVEEVAPVLQSDIEKTPAVEGAVVQDEEEVAPVSTGEEAPVQEAVAPLVDPEMLADEPDIQSKIARLTAKREALEQEMKDLGKPDWDNEEWVTPFLKLTGEWETVDDEIARLTEEQAQADAERLDSLEDSDAPPEVEAPVREERQAVTPTKKLVADICRDLRTKLPLKNADMASVRDMISRYASGVLTRDAMIQEIQSKYGEYTETYGDDVIAEVKQEIKTRGINVSDTIKGEIADYRDFMRRNFGRIRFSKSGIAVDELWHELQSEYPNFFPEDIMSPTDQLLHIAELANAPATNGETRPLPMETIEDAADAIIGAIDGYRLSQEEAAATRDARLAFDSLVKAGKAPPVEIAPVKPLEKATPETVVAPVYESKESGAAKGQTTLFAPEPKKPNPAVATVRTKEVPVNESSGIMSKVLAQVVDKGLVFENLSLETGNHELQAKWDMIHRSEAQAQYLMEHGAVDAKSLKAIMKQAKGNEDSFFDYLYHVHNIDRMTRSERFGLEDKPVFGETVTADVSREKVAGYEKAHPEFKKWAEDVYKYNRHLRQLLVQKGVISQKTADLWEKEYPHYVPVRRVDSKGQNISVPLDTNKTGVNAPVKRAVGGSSDIQPLWKTMAMRTEQTFRAIARNDFGLELMRTLGSEGIRQDSSMEEMDGFLEAQDDLAKAGTTTTSPTFTVFENGERVEFAITEDMYDALKPVNKILAHRSEVIQGMSNFRRNLLTTWNAVFSLYRNPVKDMQDVMVNSQHPLKTYANVLPAIFQMATNGRYAREYHENGGKGSTYFDGKTHKFSTEKSLFKKLIGLPVKPIEIAGEFIEEIPRLAEYMASRKDGRTVERSMLDAARVTTNFAAGGDFTKFLNAHGFTFLNASVQGAAQHARNFREAKQQGVKGWLKVAAKYTIAGLPTVLLNGLAWDDDEEYEELNDYVKQNYYIIAKREDGTFVRLPKGRTAAVMGECFQQMTNLVTGDDEVDFDTFFQLFMDNIAPSNPLTNNIIAPFWQAHTNKAWYGDDIVSESMQDIPMAEQYDESTDDFSKWFAETPLGDKLNISPIRLNYLIDQLSGGLGDVVLPMMTPEAESGYDTLGEKLLLAPWKKEVTTDSTMNNKNPGEFYGLRDELEVQANARDATDEDVLRAMYMDAVGWDMSDLYAEKREIQNSDLSDSEKFAKIREVQDKINAMAERGLYTYEDVRIDGVYAEVGGKRFNKSTNGKWYEISADYDPYGYYEREQNVTKAFGIGYGEYWNNRDAYNDAYTIAGYNKTYYTARTVFGGDYVGYVSGMKDLKADKDENGKSISGSKKQKVIDHINGLDADYGERIILFKTQYPKDDTYNQDIIDYLNARDDISGQEMKTILIELGFTVDDEGYISWE